MHKTCIFFVLDDDIRPVAQADYAKLVRGESHLREHENKVLRIADWYVEMGRGRPAKVVNETYSVLQLDQRGAVGWSRCNVGRAQNQAFYEALRHSSYDDPDEDPTVQKLRAAMKDEIAWAPNSEERRQLARLLATL
jgi:hypothetical protein